MEARIIKSKLHRDFTVVPNEILRRSDISLQAKGLFCYIQSLPEDWVVYKSNLKEVLGESRRQIDNAFQELSDKGYLISVDVIRKGLPQKEYVFYQYPYNEYPKVTNAQFGQSNAQNGHPYDAQNGHLINTNNLLNTKVNNKEKKAFLLNDIDNAAFISMFNECVDGRGKLQDMKLFKNEYACLIANNEALIKRLPAGSDSYNLIKEFIIDNSVTMQEWESPADLFKHFLNWSRKRVKA